MYHALSMPGPPWLFTLLAGLLLVSGVAVCYWALLADPPRARRRCPKCWHDMTGTPGRVCPECGHDARFEANLHRWHRHYRRLTLGLLLLIASWVAWVAPAVRRGGWIASIPAQVLLLTPESGPREFTSAANAELLQRAAAGLLGPRQLQAVVDRLAPQLLRTRPVWPTNTPIRYEAATVWASGRLGTVSLRAIGSKESTPPSPEWPRPELTHEQLWTDHQWTLPPLPAGKHDIMAEVVVARPRVDASGKPISGPPDEVWRGTVHRTILVAGSPSDILNATSGATLDEFIRDRARPRLVKLPTSGTYTIHTDRPRGPLTESLTIAIRLEILHGGKRVASACRLYPASGNLGLFNPPALLEGDVQAVAAAAANPDDLAAAVGDAEAAEPDARARAAWTVRIIGDAELALRDFNSNAYWEGTIEFPLSHLLNPPPPPESGPSASTSPLRIAQP